LHEDQFGFVKGRSTEHALSATVNEIEKEFVVATLLDIKGALDNIKPSAIIKAMKNKELDRTCATCTISTSQTGDVLAPCLTK
jgi:hypothetical protein